MTQIVKIVNEAQAPNARRTNVLLSATLTDSVKRLAEVYISMLLLIYMCAYICV